MCQNHSWSNDPVSGKLMHTQSSTYMRVSCTCLYRIFPIHTTRWGSLCSPNYIYMHLLPQETLTRYRKLVIRLKHLQFYCLDLLSKYTYIAFLVSGSATNTHLHFPNSSLKSEQSKLSTTYTNPLSVLEMPGPSHCGSTPFLRTACRAIVMCG